MIRYSVLLPRLNAGHQLACQLPELCRVLDLLVLPYEVICIDPVSPGVRAAIGPLLGQYPSLRVLTLDHPRGLEAALTAGIAAARGELVIAMGPGAQYPVHQIPNLIAELSRADIVFARQHLVGWAHAWQKLSGLAGRCLFGLEVRNTDSLFWAARREAIAGLSLPPGNARTLPWLVAMRGFRIGEISVQLPSSRPPADHAWPHPGDLSAAWSFRRRDRRRKRPGKRGLVGKKGNLAIATFQGRVMPIDLHAIKPAI